MTTTNAICRVPAVTPTGFDRPHVNPTCARYTTTQEKEDACKPSQT